MGPGEHKVLQGPSGLFAHPDPHHDHLVGKRSLRGSTTRSRPLAIWDVPGGGRCADPGPERSLLDLTTDQMVSAIATVRSLKVRCSPFTTPRATIPDPC